jgi:hypothetical protein
MLTPPKPTRVLVRKFLLALFLMVLAILIVWRFVQAPDDATETGYAKTGARPERAVYSGTHYKTRYRPARRETREGLHNNLRDLYESLKDKFFPPEIAPEVEYIAPEIAAKVLDGYLAEKQRSAQSLLGVFLISGDIALLREAAERFPHDPSVQLQMAMRGESPEERRKALDALRASDPENALGDYLSALQHIDGNKLESAFKDLSAAAGKSASEDYVISSLQVREDAYLAAGLPLVDAKWHAFMVSRPHFGKLHLLSHRLSDLQKSYSQSGEAEAAESVRQMGLRLGKSLQAETGISISTLVGFVIEKPFLDPATSAGRIAEIDQRRGEARELSSQLNSRFFKISDKDMILYIERFKQEGEEAAAKWLINR